MTSIPPLHLIRLVTYGTVLLFSIIELGLAAAIVNYIPSGNDISDDASFALAVSVISIIWLGLAVFIDLFRQGAVVIWVGIELIWLGILWILWLAAAANASSDNNIFSGGCGAISSIQTSIPNFPDFGGLEKRATFSLWRAKMVCNIYKPLQAFAWLNWIFLTAFFVALLALSVLRSSKGNSGVWKKSARENDFYGGSTPAQRNGVDMTQEKAPPAQV